MNRASRWILIAAIVLLSAIVLLIGTVFIWDTFFSHYGAARGSANQPGPFHAQQFESNGEQIYFTGTSRIGPPITTNTRGLHSMAPGRVACATCHGADGSGQVIHMMMSTIDAPNIRWGHLMEAEHHEGDHEDDWEAHPAYSEETIRLAITQGVDPAGEPLDWPMPRWHMTDAQLDDLVQYLMTLD